MFSNFRFFPISVWWMLLLLYQPIKFLISSLKFLKEISSSTSFPFNSFAMLAREFGVRPLHLKLNNQYQAWIRLVNKDNYMRFRIVQLWSSHPISPWTDKIKPELKKLNQNWTICEQNGESLNFNITHAWKKIESNNYKQFVTKLVSLIK